MAFEALGIQRPSTLRFSISFNFPPYWTGMTFVMNHLLCAISRWVLNLFLFGIFVKVIDIKIERNFEKGSFIDKFSFNSWISRLKITLLSLQSSNSSKLPQLTPLKQKVNLRLFNKHPKVKSTKKHKIYSKNHKINRKFLIGKEEEKNFFGILKFIQQKNFSIENRMKTLELATE